jgi:hypothetical protein
MTNARSFATGRAAFRAAAVAAILTVGLAACGGGDRSGNAGDTVGGTTASAGQGMGGPMMEQMQAHMRMMETSNGDSLKAMMPGHRQMMGNMLSEMSRQMRQMNMTADARWTALSDSVRQDLVRMPNLGAAELRTFMPEHRGRAMRLMEMHRSMMGGMKM